ncbi:hypothetical protein HP548_17020 [Paenibacillus taichungensis]|uniref:Uncharacterized protein n=1 Tax=Paenibacillus taichungensis TaxID=484184 RepID=A0ABX2MP40_9BACL|nr:MULTISPECIES: hypothetical protein [Paenibacillus]NUU55776.1 hypothetical protein [Paenibacillus taichungensis]PIH58911.1 hypothetical protein CS562_13240 [Paenibacillus sp. LK1]
MNAVQLPVLNPPLKGFLRWAYTLSITSAHEETIPWYYSNFIQLSCKKTFLEDGRQFYIDFFRGKPNELNFNNPFLLTCSVNYTILEHLALDAWPHFFADQIRSGYYCVVFLDEAKLPPAAAYQQEPFPHHLFLYGFDWDKRFFDASMFDHTGVYRNVQIPFTEFLDAVHSMRYLLREGLTADHHTYFYKYEPHSPYPFDRIVALDQLHDYLNGDTHLNRINYIPDDEQAFGIDVYDYLQMYYDAVESNDPRLGDRNDVRHLHVLWEHKKMMSERITYLIDEGIIPYDEELVNGYQDIATRAMKLRDQYIRHEIREDKAVFAKVRLRLEQFRKEEPVLLQRLISLLEK